MSEECEIHHKKLPCEDCQAEQQKKELIYDPDLDSPCSYCDCSSCYYGDYRCQDDDFEDEDDWEGDYP